MKFSEKIIKLRKENGLSQEEFGNKINVSRQAISKWESEQAQPEINKVKEISNIFGVSIEYLLNDNINNSEVIKNKKHENNIKKKILLIFLILVVIYLVVVIFKFIILLRYRIKANNIEDFNIYSIQIEYVENDKLTNTTTRASEEMIYKDNVALHNHYEDELAIPQTITYTDSDKREAYILTYDSKLEKYICDNREDDYYEDETEHLQIYDRTTIKDVTLQYIPNNFLDTLKASLNPRVVVSLDGDIKYQNNQGYSLVEIDTETGMINNFYIIGDQTTLHASYDYTFDNFIDNDDVQNPLKNNEINYIIDAEAY